MNKDELLYWEYDRIDSERSITPQNFDNGEILYKKNLTTATKLNLYRSYMKIILTITDEAGNPLLENDDLAPNFLALDTLFKSMYYKINNTIVSEIGDHCAQIAAANKRRMYTQGYRDTVLKDLNFGKAEFSERQKSIMQSSAGSQTLEIRKPGNQASTIEYERRSNFLDLFTLGFAGGTTIQALQPGAPENATLTFSASPNGDISTVLQVGDVIVYPNDAGINVEATIIAFNGLLVASVVNNPLIVAGNANAINATNGVFRYRDEFNDIATITGNLTTFVADLVVGDKIRNTNIDEEYTVTEIVGDTEIRVLPTPSREFLNLQNWVRVRNTNNSRGVRRLECIFKLPLGICCKDEWIIGHNFELSLFPHSDPLYKTYFMQSLNTGKTGGTTINDSYNISIENMTFYACVGHVPHSIESGSYECSFMETRCQLQNITSNTTIDRTFVVDKNTKYVTMALQDSLANSGNSLYPRTLFKVRNDIDLDLQSYAILYDIYQFPRPKHNQENSAITNRLAQAYYENTHYSGQATTLQDYEDLDTWRTLGAYYHYKVPIRKDQSNPKMSVTTSFRNELGNVRPNLLFFDHFERKFTLIARNGRIVEVKPQSQAE